MTDLVFQITEQPLGFAIAEPEPVAFETTEPQGVQFATTETVLGFPTVTNPISFVLADDQPIYFEVENLALGPSPEDVMPPPMSRRTDFVTEALIYVGEALPGTAETAAQWRIKRLTIAGDDDVTEEWAGGTGDYDKAWDSRASYTYS